MTACGLVAVSAEDSQNSYRIQPVKYLGIKIGVLGIKGIDSQLSITIVVDDELSAHGAGACQQAENCQDNQIFHVVFVLLGY